MSTKFYFNPESGRTGKREAKRKCKYGQSDSEHGETLKEWQEDQS